MYKFLSNVSSVLQIGEQKKWVGRKRAKMAVFMKTLAALYDEDTIIYEENAFSKNTSHAFFSTDP